MVKFQYYASIATILCISNYVTDFALPVSTLTCLFSGSFFCLFPHNSFLVPLETHLFRTRLLKVVVLSLVFPKCTLWHRI